jgi:hypothetical protein
MEKPMADNDDINDLCICSGAGKVTGGHRVVLFNNKYFRYVYINKYITVMINFMISLVNWKHKPIFDAF